MKQKVCVITFHEANNYGAVLQAVALQKALLKIGADPFILNYRPKTDYGFKLKPTPRNIPYIPFLNHKGNAFNKFLKNNVKLTKKCTTKNELERIVKSFDAVITGSDQVFNPKWRNGDLAYLLDFAKPQQRYSYAASFGISAISEDWESRIKGLLSEYNEISVREKTALDILNNLNLTGRTDCDPVLLLSKDEWLSLSSKVNKKNFLLIYSLENNEELLSFARKIAKNKGLSLIQITDSLRRGNNDIKYYSYHGPADFLGMFAAADYIVTNSFHGLAFSSLLEKDFTVFMQNKNGAPNSRLQDFVNKYDLNDCVYSQGGEEPHKHNFESTRNLIKADAENSYKYLKQFGDTQLCNSKSKCSYCGACYNICPTNAISYKFDSEGNKYPYLDKNKCIGCKQCEKVCPYVSSPIKNNILKAYGFANGNEKERLESRSGGLFFTIAKGFISNGGVVYGAVIDSQKKVKHIRACDLESIKLMQKSKYVQSDYFEHNIKDIIQDLSNGLEVFVSGTPCFINAVNKVCEIKKITTKNLYTMDVVCHGTPTQMIFDNYISKIEKDFGPVDNFKFRDKDKGWNSHFESFIDSANNKHFSQEYADLFYSHVFQRPSCYNCQFSNLNRPSDITGADFWGGQNLKEFSDNKGASLVLVNTDKGNRLLDKYVFNNGTIKEIELANFMQDHLSKPLEIPANRDKVWDIYYRKSFDATLKLCSKKANKIRSSNKRKAAIVKLLRKLHIKK